MQTSETPYTQSYADLFGCSHIQRVLYREKWFCKSCGLYMNNPSTKVYKTLKMKYNAFFNPMPLIDQVNISKTVPPVFMNRSQLIDFMEQTAERLHLTTNTVVLAIQYMDEVMQKKTIDNLYLYGAVSLMVAAKAQELDERIPFISKVKRYAQMTNHPEIAYVRIEDFKAAERTIIQALDWKLQQVTLVDRVETLLSMGVIDDDDSLGQQKENKDVTLSKVDIQHQKLRDISESQILTIVKEIEANYCHIIMNIIREPIYQATDQAMLCLSVVAYLRKKAGLLNIWSQQLQALSGTSAQRISQSVSQIMTIMNKTKLRTQTHSYIESQYTSLTNTPQNVPLTSFQYNTQSTRFIFDKQPRQPKLPVPQASVHTTSQPNLSKKKRLGHQYTYLNINENSGTSYLMSDLDKKYEQSHKVSTSLLKNATKIYNM